MNSIRTGKYRIRDGVGVVLVFFLIYNVSFTLFPTASTGRLAMAFLIFAGRKSLFRFLGGLLNSHPAALLILAGCFVHAVVAYTIGGREDSTQVSRLFNFALYSMLGSVLLADYLAWDRKRFLAAFSLAAGIQGAFILYSLFSLEYRDWIATVLVESGNKSFGESLRPPGFSNSVGASLAVVQALGFLAGLWSARLSESRVWVGIHGLGATLCLISTFLSGRTGLLLCGLFLGVFCLRDILRLRFKMVLGSALTAGLLVLQGPWILNKVLSMQFEGGQNIDKLANWALEFFVSGEETASIQHLKSMKVPPVTWETLIGTGLVKNSRNRNASGHDSGYIQTYYSLGLLMAAFCYGSILFLMFSTLKGDPDPWLVSGLCVALLLIEVKEPFVFKYAFPFFIFSLNPMKLVAEAHGKGFQEAKAGSFPASLRAAS